MKRNILHIIFSLIFTFAVLSPPVIQLFNLNDGVIVMIDLNEEENQNKNQNELKEKQMCVLSSFLSEDESTLKRLNYLNYYQEGISDFVAKIQLPPPRHT
jgi:hypothetical protein